MLITDLAMPLKSPAQTADYFTPVAAGCQARLLLVGSEEKTVLCKALVRHCDIGMVACVTPDISAAHLRRMALVDIVWIADADTLRDDDLADLASAIAERGCRLLCETALARLDRITGSFEAVHQVEYLVECDDTDRLIALAAVLQGRNDMVHDVARDGTMERIDRLQDEVARISRLLNELTERKASAFSIPHYHVPQDERMNLSAHVRAPVRDFAAGPRSFSVGEGNTGLRNKAKRVRRIIRERRMREHFFPADLFADPAWDMLLDLYAARLEQQPVAVSSLCIAAAVPATTALRWIKTMTESGLFVREADPQDGRRIFIALGDSAAEGLDRYFEALDE